MIGSTARTGTGRVVVLTTGGTIASRTSADGVVVGLSGHELVAPALTAAPGPIEVQDLLLVNGYAIDTHQMLEVAQAVHAAARRPGIAGIVVTHGTDTLEETAYLTDLLHDGDVPVVFTGAQRHAEHPDSDGPSNLRTAVALAASQELRGAGVLVALEGRIDTARDATKLHSHALRAFGTAGVGPIAEHGPAGLRILGTPQRRPPLRPRTLDARVALVRTVAGDDGVLIDAAREAGADGIVLEAFGLGNVNRAMLASVGRAVRDGAVVLVTTRCPAGGVAAVYGNGGGVDLQRAGAVLAGTLAGIKARILLMAALGVGGSATAVRAAVKDHL
jgi:L-asparaginase